MALRIHLLCFPSQSAKSQFNRVPSINTRNNSPRFQKISCANNDLSDLELAVDFATEVEKMNTQMLQREEALKKSKELLFMEFCNFMGLNSEEMKKKWKRLSDEDKKVLVKEFVVEWAARFHPLSAKSVKELVDEYLVDNTSDSVSVSSSFFPGLRKLLGFSVDDNQ